jgi:hypothetical protein
VIHAGIGETVGIGSIVSGNELRRLRESGGLSHPPLNAAIVGGLRMSHALAGQIAILKGRRTLAAVLALALEAQPGLATADPADPMAVSSKHSWGLAASGGLVGGLGLANARSSFGVEGALWLGKIAPTRAVGLDAGWSTNASYAEIQMATSLWYAHDGALDVGLGAGPLYDRANGGRWGGQATTWIALTPFFIFPYARIERARTDGPPAISAGLMMKILAPFYTPR